MKVIHTMKITKNSSVKFVATVYDKWGIVPKDKTFSFSIRYCHVNGSKDNDNFNKFNKLVELGQVKEVKIAGEVIKDIPKAIEIVKEETSKWEKVKYFKMYRVARHDSWKGDVWVEKSWNDRFGYLIEGSDLNYLVSLFGESYSLDTSNWTNNWSHLLILDNYFVHENSIETGEFSKMSDEHQVRFRNDAKELFNRKMMENA